MKMRFFGLLIVLTSAIAANAQSTRALQSFEIGMKASETGDHLAALSEFKDTLRLIEREGAADRFFAKVHYNLGVSNYKLQRLNDTVAEYSKALRFAGGSYGRASYALGLTHSELGNWRDAEKAFRQAIVQNHRDGEAWFDLAFVYLAMGENERAINAFQKAVKYRAAETAVSHNNIGVLLAAEGKTREAETEFEKAFEISKGSLSQAAANLENLGAGSPTTRRLEIAKRQQTGESPKTL